MQIFEWTRKQSFGLREFPADWHNPWLKTLSLRASGTAFPRVVAELILIQKVSRSAGITEFRKQWFSAY
ncbi:hypothetical protein [Frateuria aurantia]|uniref:hypothetical protein n=1 Tax=Frateuria aurantia TaxID=81475 RepID=UPI00059C6568|nr:hypothetical protein [Frateuria aurantia]